MKVLMIGTPTCIRCKSLAPKLEDYCKNHNIEYQYIDIQEVPSDIMDILIAKNIKQAPVFFIDRGEETILVSEDDIFLELESL